MELLCTEQVASLHRSVAFCESESVILHCLWEWVTYRLKFCVWVHFSSRKTDRQVRDGMWGAAPVECKLNLIILSLFDKV
jgi:hypothetical protein